MQLTPDAVASAQLVFDYEPRPAKKLDVSQGAGVIMLVVIVAVVVIFGLIARRGMK